MYFKDINAAIMVYDITFRVSFEACKDWIKDLRDSCEDQDLLIALVGNKSDMFEKAEVTLEEAMSFGKEIKAEIVKETSAKDNMGISELFQEIAQKLYKKHKSKL